MAKTATKKSGMPLLALAGGVSFAAALLLLAPASLATAFLPSEHAGFSYSAIEGTIWQGRVKNAALSGVSLGDVDYKISLTSLLALSPQTELSFSGGVIRGKGAAKLGLGGRFEISDTAIDVNLGPFARRGILGSPVEGRAEITVSEFAATRAGCQKASGQLWTNVLDGPVKRFRGGTFPLAGALSCDGNDLLIALKGENQDGSADLNIRIRPDLSYEILATAHPQEDNVASALKVFGFEDQNGALIYGSAGVLDGAGI